MPDVFALVFLRVPDSLSSRSRFSTPLVSCRFQPQSSNVHYVPQHANGYMHIIPAKGAANQSCTEPQVVHLLVFIFLATPAHTTATRRPKIYEKNGKAQPFCLLAPMHANVVGQHSFTPDASSDAISGHKRLDETVRPAWVVPKLGCAKTDASTRRYDEVGQRTFLLGATSVRLSCR